MTTQEQRAEIHGKIRDILREYTNSYVISVAWMQEDGSLEDTISHAFQGGLYNAMGLNAYQGSYLKWQAKLRHKEEMRQSEGEEGADAS